MKLEILQKLIALANNNPNDNEANLAARKACKAIVEHNFIITYQGQSNTAPPKTNTPPKQPNYKPYPGAQQSYYEQTYDPFEDLFGRARGSKFYEEFFGGAKGGGKNKTQEEKQKQHEGNYQKYKPKSDELRERENSWSYEYYVANTGQYWNPLTHKYYNKMFQDLWFEETGTRHVSDTAAFRAGANYGRPEGEGTYQKKQYNPYTGQSENTQRKNKKYSGDDRYLKCKTCGNYFNTKFVGLEEVFECNECQWTAFEKGKTPPKEEQKYGNICHMTGKKCNTPVTCAGMGCQVFVKR